MRNKIAKALRKEIKYKQTSEEKKNREYQEIEHIVRRPIWSLGQNEKGEAIKEIVIRDVPAFQVECVSGNRKVYQYLKKKYKNFATTAEFNQLPTIDEMAELAQTILGGINGSNTNDNTNGSANEEEI